MRILKRILIAHKAISNAATKSRVMSAFEAARHPNWYATNDILFPPEASIQAHSIKKYVSYNASHIDPLGIQQAIVGHFRTDKGIALFYSLTDFGDIVDDDLISSVVYTHDGITYTMHFSNSLSRKSAQRVTRRLVQLVCDLS